MTHYEQRKAWRVKLNASRQADKDNTKERFMHDAKVLNRAMSIFKITGRTANWSK